MPTKNNQLQWLNTRYTTLLQELEATTTGETTEKLLELLRVNQQLQSQLLLTILAKQEQQRQDTDTQLTEISQYLQEIVTTHIMEAENLEKIR